MYFSSLELQPSMFNSSRVFRQDSALSFSKEHRAKPMMPIVVQVLFVCALVFEVILEWS